MISTEAGPKLCDLSYGNKERKIATIIFYALKNVANKALYENGCYLNTYTMVIKINGMEFKWNNLYNWNELKTEPK